MNEKGLTSGLNQQEAPLFAALQAYVAQVRAPYHMPGHKMGHAAPPEWRQFMGENALRIDLTEAPGLDDLHAPSGAILAAERLAADAFGAAESYFLVGGTTAGLHGLILTACRPGESIVLPRHAHRSILGATILAGARPKWVPVQFDPDLDVAIGPEPKALAAALPGSSAALLVHPTYFGAASDVASQIEMIHQAGLPVLVDGAHGTHFGFHPALPPSSLHLGADGVVQSVHKTGGSLTQSAICHLGRGSRLEAARLRQMLPLVQSTSPSYLLMASLDLARRELALHGEAMWDRALTLATTARRQLAQCKGIRVAPAADPTKLLIDVRGRRLTGFQAYDLLWERGVALEASGLGWVLALLTHGDEEESVAALVKAVNELPEGTGLPPRPPAPPEATALLTPREAFLAAKELVPLADATGRIAAEMVCPYPPGIPVVVPGEQLSPDVIEYLQAARHMGNHLQGPSDPELRYIQVVRE
ncbi:MAG: aminotransferase class I/II-fold pyridoxal phosphate-dependent enzyme [Mycobacterium leprae]